MLALESTKRHASEWRCEDIPRKNSLREGHSSRVGSALQQPRGKETGGKANSALPAGFCSLLGSASALLLLLLLSPFADTESSFFRFPTWTGEHWFSRNPPGFRHQIGIPEVSRLKGPTSYPILSLSSM